MAFAANLNFNFFFSRANGETIAASAFDGCFGIICRMNIFFHNDKDTSFLDWSQTLARRRLPYFLFLLHLIS